MTYLVASSFKDDLSAVRRDTPELWRQVRRYNLPVQLALAAAEDVSRAADDIKTAAVFSLAPCQTGSADVYRWVRLIREGMAAGSLGDTRMNPTQTLHAVDNLALSAFSIMHANRAYCLGLGGAAGQAWAALEALHERLARGDEREALLISGDQADADADDARGLGVALLFSAAPRPYEADGERRKGLLRLVGVERRRAARGGVVPHAAAGLRGLVSALEKLSPENRDGARFGYDVPHEDADGCDALRVVWEVGG